MPANWCRAFVDMYTTKIVLGSKPIMCTIQPGYVYSQKSDTCKAKKAICAQPKMHDTRTSRTLLHNAAHYSTLPRTATHCNALQHADLHAVRNVRATGYGSARVHEVAKELSFVCDITSLLCDMTSLLCVHRSRLGIHTSLLCVHRSLLCGTSSGMSTRFNSVYRVCRKQIYTSHFIPKKTYTSHCSKLQHTQAATPSGETLSGLCIIIKT